MHLSRFIGIIPRIMKRFTVETIRPGDVFIGNVLNCQVPADRLSDLRAQMVGDNVAHQTAEGAGRHAHDE